MAKEVGPTNMLQNSDGYLNIPVDSGILNHVVKNQGVNSGVVVHMASDSLTRTDIRWDCWAW